MAILARGEDHLERPGVEIGRGEPPLGQVLGIVGQIPALQVHAFGAGIVNLDPVLIRAVLIGQRVCVGGHEFGNDHLARGVGCELQSQSAKKEGGGQLSHRSMQQA